MITHIESKQTLAYIACNNVFGSRKVMSSTKVIFTKLYNMFCRKTRMCRVCYIGSLYNKNNQCLMRVIEYRYAP